MDRNIILNRIKNTIHRNDPKADTYLFGSRARGNNRSGSDWDILILVNSGKITNEIEDKFRENLYDIELESGQIISTFIYPKNYWKTKLKFSPLYKHVNNDGVKILLLFLILIT